MRKDFFLKTGKYDEEMEIWGPDNVELSLRVRESSKNVLSVSVFLTLLKHKLAIRIVFLLGVIYILY